MSAISNEKTFYVLMGRKICHIREKNGVSHDKMAMAIGMESEELCDIEQGVTPISVLQLQKMASYFNLTVEDFLPAKNMDAFSKIVSFPLAEKSKLRAMLSKKLDRLSNKTFSKSLKSALDKVASTDKTPSN